MEQSVFRSSAREFTREQLRVRVFETRAQLGAAAADAFTEKVQAFLETRPYVNAIFASAPSQNEFLAELRSRPLEWNRINAFHMDEYIGLAADAPQGFGIFLKERLFDFVDCRAVYYLNGSASDAQEECRRYTALLEQYPTDIVCLGIGENTHLAFNDPHVADFNDPETVKIVDLDEQCRLQQVNDGCFPTIDDVPTHALTITIPALFRSGYAQAVVPGSLKAEAIYHTLNDAISEQYPSTILRRHPDAVLFVDEMSAQKL